MDRREFLATLSLTLAGFPITGLTQEPTGPRRPDPGTFESGDIVWPKKQGAFVPYASSTEEASVDDDEMLWKKERADFIRRARSGKLGSTPDEIAYWKRVADRIELLDFQSFYHAYAANSSPNAFVTYGGGEVLYVGHVGIIEVDPVSNQAYVIEAVMGKGTACEHCVSRVSYDEWLKGRGDILVWHARLQNKPSEQRSAIASYAKQQALKPYDFWNFDLSNESGFYCSKLVWQSTQRATGIWLDDNPDPRREFWYSPLQVMKSRHLNLLSSPGRYRNV